MQPITCPAGDRIAETVQGRGCNCRIEGTVVPETRNGRVYSSLATYCEGVYTECPTWRWDKERGWEQDGPVR